MHASLTAGSIANGLGPLLPAPLALLITQPTRVRTPSLPARFIPLEGETDVPGWGVPLSVSQKTVPEARGLAVMAATVDDNTPGDSLTVASHDAPDALKNADVNDNDDDTDDAASPALTPIPQNVIIKPLFEERYRQLFGDQYDEFIKYSLSYIRKCIRVNTLKISVDELRRRLEPTWNLIPVPWCPEGFFISHKNDERFDLGNLIEHQLGYIYIQDAASMIPPVVLKPAPGERVLDLCAAPGSKTTQLAQYLDNDGLLVANDADLGRLKPLGLNLQRCGVTCSIVTLRANERMRELGLFDKVLVDAPCSGTGTVRRSLKTLLMWGPGLVRKMAGIQRQLVRLGFSLLKPGGTLVYSTCTMEPEENEGVVDWLLKNEPQASVESFTLDIKRSPTIETWAGTTYSPEVRKTLRIAPQDNDTEGFFVARLQKRPWPL